MKTSKNITSTKIKSTPVTFNVNLIDSSSENSVLSTIQTGQRIRNGANRFFSVTVTEKQILLTALNSEKAQTLAFGKTAFAQLFKRKHFDQILTETPLKEVVEAIKIGSNRLIIKHEMPLWS